jgi:hypothetical protein
MANYSADVIIAGADLAGFWQLNSRRLQNIQHLQSSHCPTPLCKRTFPEISIVLCSDKMAPKIEQVVNGSMST